MLPTVDFCGIEMTRLIIGANPFGGFSHQNSARDAFMKNFHTPEQILITWDRAWKAGINTFVTNTETPHVVETTKKYIAEGGPMNWIGQLGKGKFPNMESTIDFAVQTGCKALFFHGGMMDKLFQENDERTVHAWVDHAKAYGIPVGIAGHSPKTHIWVNKMDIVDFHVVPLFNCGSLHDAGGGEHFWFEDLPRAIEVIQNISKPCIAYKVLAAGRIDAYMGLGFAYRNIKPGDVINLGMNRADNDNIVEEDVQIVSDLLANGAK